MITDEIKGVILKLNEFDDIYEELPNQLSIVDSKICDLMHLIENTNLKTNECYRVIRKLKQLRNERRKIKDNYTLLKTFNTHINKLMQNDNRKMLLAEINKTKKYLAYPYKNRIYTDDEIDDILKGVIK